MEVLDKTRLIFSFYLTNENLYNDINQLHLRLLAKYINRFEDVIFCIIVDDNIVLVEGRLSVREDEPVKIVATNVKEFSEVENFEEKSEIKLNSVKTMNINITDLDENQKSRLRGAIKFFSGDRVNVKLEITDKDNVKPCGGIFLTDKVLDVFKEIVKEENIKIY